MRCWRRPKNAFALAVRARVHPQLDGKPAEDEIRSARVTQHVSQVARMQRVRDWVNEQVARLPGRTRSSWTAGTWEPRSSRCRPEDLLVADPWERARRRLIQQLQRSPTEEEIAEETDRLVHRDAKDAQQTGQAPDAVFLDTTYLTQEEQVDRIVALANAVTQRGDGTSEG